MAAEYSSVALQTVQPLQNVLFTDAPVPCKRGFINHRSGSGVFTLQSIYSPFINSRCSCGCGNCNNRTTEYLVTFGANIAVPEGGTVTDPISIGLSINGEVYPESTMIYTPAAVEEFGNVSRTIHIPVPAICGCEEVAVKNLSTQAIDVQNASIVFQIPQLNVTR